MTDQEVADLLRTAEFALDHCRTSLVAFGDPKYSRALQTEYDRVGRALALIKDALKDLPPQVPLTPEREAKVGAFIGAVLDKRFGDGSQDAVDAALRAMVVDE